MYMYMKIGIMTFWWSNDNYGQQLQCYALQKYLRDAGHDVFLIRYDKSNDYTPNVLLSSPPPSNIPSSITNLHEVKKLKWKNIFNPIKLCKFIKRLISNLINNVKQFFITQKEKSIIYKQKKHREREILETNRRNFSIFRSTYIKQSEQIYYYYDELKNNPPQADIYIVGSDQVWNPDSYLSIFNQTNAYFLNFGNKSTKRISYAPSFCKDNLNSDFINIVNPLLQNFDYISVREKSDLNACRQCGIENAELVPDPTLLLNADIYRKFYNNEIIKRKRKRYCFFYFLDNPCNFSVDSVYNWANKKKLDVIYIPSDKQIDMHKKTFATIPEWIYLLEHSEYVITNSYHCVIFSLLFKKTFGVIPLTDGFIDLNNRMYTLFEMFNLNNRFINNYQFDVLNQKIDWDFVSDKIKILKNNCKLLKIINKNSMEKI